MTGLLRKEEFFVRSPGSANCFIGTQGVFTINLPGLTSWRLRMAAWAIAFIAEKFIQSKAPGRLDCVTVTLDYGVVLNPRIEATHT